MKNKKRTGIFSTSYILSKFATQNAICFHVLPEHFKHSIYTYFKFFLCHFSIFWMTSNYIANTTKIKQMIHFSYIYNAIFSSYHQYLPKIKSFAMSSQILFYFLKIHILIGTLLSFRGGFYIFQTEIPSKTDLFL